MRQDSQPEGAGSARDKVTVEPSPDAPPAYSEHEADSEFSDLDAGRAWRLRESFLVDVKRILRSAYLFRSQYERQVLAAVDALGRKGEEHAND